MKQSVNGKTIISSRTIRKTRKVSDNLSNNLESIKEGASSPVLIANTLVSGRVENMLEKEAVAGHGASLKVVEDMLLEKASNGCSDIEHVTGGSRKKIKMQNSKETSNEDNRCVKDMCVVDTQKESFEQAKRAKLNVIPNAAHEVCSVEDNFDQSTRICEDEVSCDASARDSPSAHLDQKRKSNIEDNNPPLSQLGATKDGTEIINTDKHDKHLLEASPASGPTSCSRKKLLVLDVNGLLADIVADVPFRCRPDTIIGTKAVFKRPFCDDFLQFCFERFNVGVWSSRTMRNVHLVLDFLMRQTRHKLVFVWDQSHCTETGLNTVENREKPLVLKELKKLWEKHEPHLPWEKGEYNESNTLLLDDSPHKALRNPPYTAIFPHSYRFRNMRDNSLGPGGDLRVYLEGLALADNVQKYVEQNPFGQRPITKKNLSWGFYLKVIGNTSSQPEDDASRAPHP